MNESSSAIDKSAKRLFSSSPGRGRSGESIVRIMVVHEGVGQVWATGYLQTSLCGTSRMIKNVNAAVIVAVFDDEEWLPGD